MDFLTQDASQLPIWAILLALVPAVLFSISRAASNRDVQRRRDAWTQERLNIGKEMRDIYGGRR